MWLRDGCFCLAWCAAIAAQPVFAQTKQTESQDGSAAVSPDDKLPAQLPSITVQGRDLSGSDPHGNAKILPSASGQGIPIRLPEPAQIRATSDDNRRLVVNVTPSTVEALPNRGGPRLPYTLLEGGLGVSGGQSIGRLYDARYLGAGVLGTELNAMSGLGWARWRAKEWFEWPKLGRVDLQAESLAWAQPSVRGNQSVYHAAYDYGETDDWLAGISLQRAFNRSFVGGGSDPLPMPILNEAGHLEASVLQARFQFRGQRAEAPAPLLKGQLQHRIWGVQSGFEGYFSASDSWSLAEPWRLEGRLGGGFWGREWIVDPGLMVHYRPNPSAHAFLGMKAQSVLPDFRDLYMLRLAAASNLDLQAERILGWAELGGSQRLSERVWLSAALDMKPTWRRVYWADPDQDGLWMPVNADQQQWCPAGRVRAQLQWAPMLQHDLHYQWEASYPLGWSEHKLGTTLEASLANTLLGVSVGADWRLATLSSLQTPRGGIGSGFFASTALRYRWTPDLSLILMASELPLAVTQPALNYFMPLPVLTLNAQYQF